MKSLYSIIFLCILFSCKDQQKSAPSPSIQFTLNLNYALVVKGISYSLIANNSDTVQIKNSGPSQTDSIYVTLLNKVQRNKLDNLITNLNLNKLDTLYESYDIDGETYRLTISKNDTVKSVYVHSFNIPNDLKELTNYLKEFVQSVDQIPLTNNQ